MNFPSLTFLIEDEKKLSLSETKIVGKGDERDQEREKLGGKKNADS